jgi:hypothetical protein
LASVTTGLAHQYGLPGARFMIWVNAR